MPSYELPDHAIAHTVHQKILENHRIQSVAEVYEFWEREELQVHNSTERYRVLRKDEFERLPVTLFNMKENKNGDLRE